MKKKLVVTICMVSLLALSGCGKKSNEKELTQNLEKLGRSFYEEFYYVHQEEALKQQEKSLSEFLSQYAEIGIKADLENISKTSVADKKLVDSMVNSETNEKCDVKNSSVTFYPKAPYGKTDYEVKVELECGFKK